MGGEGEHERGREGGWVGGEGEHERGREGEERERGREGGREGGGGREGERERDTHKLIQSYSDHMYVLPNTVIGSYIIMVPGEEVSEFLYMIINQSCSD